MSRTSLAVVINKTYNEEKKMKVRSIIILSASILLAGEAFAHGNKVEMTHLSVTRSLELFAGEQSQSTVRSFSGVKAWLSGSTAKVKVFLSGSSSLVYSCRVVHSNGGEEGVECEL